MRPKSLKKVVATALTAAMVVTLMPAKASTANAAGEPEPYVEAGESVTPDITWTRSEETKYSNSSTRNVGEIKTNINYREDGELVWDWSDISNINASENRTGRVWDYNTDYQYATTLSEANGISAATWVNWRKNDYSNRYSVDDGQHTDDASVRHFIGTFEWPEGYDLQDVGKLISVNDENYSSIYSAVANLDSLKDKTVLAINDDMYVFIHRADDPLNAQNYREYLAFWSGTSGKGTWSSGTSWDPEYDNTEPDQYQGQYATRAFYGHVPTEGDYPGNELSTAVKNRMRFSDTWYTFADTAGIASTLQNHYDDIEAGTKMQIDIFAFDYNGVGGMDELEFQLTKRQQEAQTVTVEYYVDTLNPDGYIGQTVMNNVMPGTEITLYDGTAANELNHMKLKAIEKCGQSVSDGVQQGSIPYTVEEDGENIIRVLYTGSALPEKSFVIDYGKDVDYTQDEVFGAGGSSELNQFDGAQISYSLRDGENRVETKEGTYGTMTVNNTEDKFLQYSLNDFMNGVDSYTLDLTLEDGQTTAHVAKAVNMIPASNVYYEDDFTETSGEGNVKIVYSDGWNQTGSTPADDVQSSENITYGYDESYANQLEASNGTVHTSNAGAKASFQFTGTGTDIYSYTDDQSGTVMARLYKVNEDGTETFQAFAHCNNYAQNGRYYTVPTVSFNDLEYGTYKVSLAVYTSSAGTSTYYLDGIRVYNPLGTVTDDNSAAGNAYKEAGELNAKYTEIRTMLLDNLAETAGDGMLYIDNLNGDTQDISVYESDGPEHEIYLGKYSAIAFTLENFDPEQDGLYVGIKSAKGESGQVTVTNGNTQLQAPITINSTMDQYYKITPDESGNVVIRNNGEGVIALTKVRTTSPETNDITFKSTKETLQAAQAFAMLPIGEEVTVPVADETPDSAEDGSEAAEPSEDSETILNPDDVIIENPEQDETADDSGSFIENIVQQTFEDVFNNIFSWFWGGR